MNTQEIKLISLDFDGTIMVYDQGEEYFHPQIIGVLNHLKKHEIGWVANSGRNIDSQKQVLETSRKYGLTHEPLALLCSETLVYPRHLNDYISDEVWNAPAHKTLLRFHGQLQQRISPLLPQWEKKYRMWHVELHPMATAFCVDDEADGTTLFFKELQDMVAQLSEGDVTRNGQWIIAIPKVLGKGAILEYTRKQHQLDPCHVLAIGDHLNDLTKLHPDIAHHLACPGDAVMEVKTAVLHGGGYVAQAHGPEGTLEALTHYLPLIIEESF